MVFNFRKKIDDIAEHVTSLNFLAQYAKASEADGHFKKAAQAYETAHDYENAVRYATYYDMVGKIDANNIAIVS